MLTNFLRLSLNWLNLARCQSSSVSTRTLLSWITLILLAVVVMGALTACTVSQQPPDVCSGKYCDPVKDVKPLPDPAS